MVKETIEEALAQPEPWEKFCDSNCVWTDHHPDCKLAEQKPVAWLNEEKKIIYWHNTHETDDYHGFKRTTPLYTTPPQRKPLSNEEIDRLWSQSLADTEGETYLPLREFARAIEAAHNIKGEA
jgi:hypothetical protein